MELATQTLVSEDRPVYKTVSGFLSAMLTGQGDLAPYVAAGSGLTAAQPPRFTTMAIERVQTSSDLANAQDVPHKADGIEVAVRAVLQTASGVLMPINDAPSIIAPTDSGPSQPSTTPTTTTTTPPMYAPSTPEGS